MNPYLSEEELDRLASLFRKTVARIFHPELNDLITYRIVTNEAGQTIDVRIVGADNETKDLMTVPYEELAPGVIKDLRLVAQWERKSHKLGREGAAHAIGLSDASYVRRVRRKLIGNNRWPADKSEAKDWAATIQFMEKYGTDATTAAMESLMMDGLKKNRTN